MSIKHFFSNKNSSVSWCNAPLSYFKADIKCGWSIFFLKSQWLCTKWQTSISPTGVVLILQFSHYLNQQFVLLLDNFFIVFDWLILTPSFGLFVSFFSMRQKNYCHFLRLFHLEEFSWVTRHKFVNVGDIFYHENNYE